jgi:hypothetical protein
MKESWDQVPGIKLAEPSGKGEKLQRWIEFGLSRLFLEPLMANRNECMLAIHTCNDIGDP